jgi:dihydroorotate dehydrogenase
MGSEIDLSVQLAPHNKRGLLLSNPVITASGTFGYGKEMEGLLDTSSWGLLSAKEPPETTGRQSQPRLAETPDGMLNAIGLQNKGVEALIRDELRGGRMAGAGYCQTLLPIRLRIMPSWRTGWMMSPESVPLR